MDHVYENGTVRNTTKKEIREINRITEDEKKKVIKYGRYKKKGMSKETKRERWRNLTRRKRRQK